MTLGKTPNGKLSEPYISRVNSFINFAIAVMDSSGNILYPCIQCMNCYQQFLYVVRVHLLHRRIMQSCTKWYDHGEPHVLNENINDNEMLDGDHMDGINALVSDRIRKEPRNANQDE